MDTINLQATDYTPKVILDKENQIFEFSGCSLPEDSVKFYTPIIQWISRYTEYPNEKTKIVFDLDYVNSSSSKMIIDFLYVLQKAKEKGADIEIIWKYDASDDVIETIGTCIQETTDLSFTLLPYN